MYRAHRNSEKVREWAGISDYNPKAVSRISELADKIDSNFSALENTWKKVQSFIDAKSETERLENELAHYQTVFNQEFEKVMKDNNFHSDNQKEVEKARELANENMMKQFGTNLIIAQDKFNRAKINKDNIERTEKNKKAEAIANAARNIQQATAQYSDVLIAKDKILARETDVSKRAAMEQAIARYGNLSNKDAYDRLVADIRSGVKEANDYIDYLDKYNQEARQEKANQQFQEQQRASSVSKSGGKGNGEKH